MYQPVVLKVLKQLVVLDLTRNHAYLNEEDIFWGDMSGKVVAHIPMTSDEYALFIGQACA